jgi:hypothetical protein
VERLLPNTGSPERDKSSARAELARFCAARAVVLAAYFITLKIYLALWYAHHDISAVFETPGWALPGLAGSDVLAAGAMFAVSLVFALPALLGRSRAMQIVGKVTSLLPFLVAGLLACISLKVNQAYGRPLSFGLLSFASSLGPMRDSIANSMDATFVVAALTGVLLLVAAPSLLRADRWKLGMRRISLLVLAIGLGGGTVAFTLFRNINTFGLKTNPLIELARS